MISRLGWLRLWLAFAALWLLGAGGYAREWWPGLSADGPSFESRGINLIAALACRQSPDDVFNRCLLPPVETWLAVLTLAPPVAALLAGIALAWAAGGFNRPRPAAP